MLVELLPFAAIGAGFWLLFIRPIRRRRAQQAKLVASLAAGQRIMTTAGVFGTVVGIEAERVRVEVAPGVVIEMLAVAVAEIIAADVIDATDPATAADAEQPSGVLDRPVESEPMPAPGEESERG